MEKPAAMHTPKNHATSTRRFYRYAKRTLLLGLCLSLFATAPLQAQANGLFVPDQVDQYWWETKKATSNCNAKPTNNGTGSDIDRFLRALAQQESGGNPNAVALQEPYVDGNPIPLDNNAKGKYQYQDATWISHANAYYPPAAEYPTALHPPVAEREAIQDALAFFEYTQKFITYDGDVLKMAMSHFYPAALEQDAPYNIIDEVANRNPGGGNVFTPLQYAQAFVEKYENNQGSEIPLKYQDAPQFQELYDQLPNASANPSVQPVTAKNCDGGTSEGEGNIVKTAKGLAWPSKGFHGPDQSEARAEYIEAIADLEMPNDATAYSDCGVFVSTVMRLSGADPEYPQRGTAVQLPYLVENSGPGGKYTEIDLPDENLEAGAESGVLQPGDILITSSNVGTFGHTMIYTGPYDGDMDGDGDPADDDGTDNDDEPNYNAVDASLNSRVPQAQNVYFSVEGVPMRIFRPSPPAVDV